MLFTGIAVFFIFIHLMIGRLVRPNRPDAEKLTIYECGEPTIGSSWIQFDLRFYVVALLFVVFDVEMAFFFPWAVVFGKANQMADVSLPAERRLEIVEEMTPPLKAARAELQARLNLIEQGLQNPDFTAEQKARLEQLKLETNGRLKLTQKEVPNNAPAARAFALIAFVDILVFFAVLVVGFAYLWKRGDLDWVRSTAAQHPEDS
jgi:NADH-quinone oxidoreductase subunit A